MRELFGGPIRREARDRANKAGYPSEEEALRQAGLDGLRQAAMEQRHGDLGLRAEDYVRSRIAMRMRSEEESIRRKNEGKEADSSQTPPPPTMLPTSGKMRIRRRMSKMVANVCRKEGRIWEAISDIQERYDIEPQAEIPPTEDGVMFLPPGAPKEVSPGEDGHEEWLTFLEQWSQELRDLYKEFVPEDCREPLGSDVVNWMRFFSGLIIYDPVIGPPHDPWSLKKFRDALDGPRRSTHLMPAEGEPDYVAIAPPLEFLHDRQQRDEIERERQLLIIGAIQERPDVLENRSPEEVMDDLLRNKPGLSEELRAVEDKYERKPVLFRKPYHAKQDIEAGATILKAITEKRLPPGHKERDELLNVEAAILDERGIRGKELADYLGLRYASHINEKYITPGKKFLFDS